MRQPKVDPHFLVRGRQRLVGTSTTNEAWYRPAASTVSVTDDASPGRSRDQRTGTSPTPGSRNRPAEVTRNRAAFVNRIDCDPVPLGPEPRRTQPAALPGALH